MRRWMLLDTAKEHNLDEVNQKYSLGYDFRATELLGLNLNGSLIKSAKHKTMDHVKIYFHHAVICTATTFEPRILFSLLSTGYVFNKNCLNLTTN
jgi:hypothetical protein